MVIRGPVHADCAIDTRWQQAASPPKRLPPHRSLASRRLCAQTPRFIMVDRYARQNVHNDPPSWNSCSTAWREVGQCGLCDGGCPRYGSQPG